MKPLYVRHDPSTFWEEYWRNASVDPPRFVDRDIYPIHPTIKHLNPAGRILECGFGGGRVIRHLANSGYVNVVGLEYDRSVTFRLREVQKLSLTVGDVRALPFRTEVFDATLAFGLLGTLERDFNAGLKELIRVTATHGVLAVSLMLDNLARRCQSLLSRWSAGPPMHFYAWTHTEQGWQRLLEGSGLEIVERAHAVSRYNFYHWTPFFRKKGVAFDQAQARVCDRAFQLNRVGEALFLLSSRLFPSWCAAGCLYICRKRTTERSIIQRDPH